MPFNHKKSLGQNFLHNRKLLEKISKIKKLFNEYVIEIGPGSGSLTEFILRENPKNLTVIEKDEDLKPNLSKFKERYPKNFNLIFNDALTFDFSTLTKKKNNSNWKPTLQYCNNSNNWLDEKL